MESTIKWKPISSAPKDGTPILLWGPLFVHCSVGVWHERREDEHDKKSKKISYWAQCFAGKPVEAMRLYRAHPDRIGDPTLWAATPAPEDDESYVVESPEVVASMLSGPADSDNNIRGVVGFLRRLSRHT